MRKTFNTFVKNVEGFAKLVEDYRKATTTYDYIWKAYAEVDFPDDIQDFMDTLCETIVDLEDKIIDVMVDNDTTDEQDAKIWDAIGYYNIHD